MTIWKKFAEHTTGTFKEGHSSHSDSVEIEYKNWKIVFDNYRLWSGKYSAEMTRIVAPITLKDNFKFEIYKEGFIRKIEKIFGAEDIEIGYDDFDKMFTIKSNNEFKIKTLLRNKEIRDLISSQKDVNIQISDQKGIWEQKLPENEFELSYFIDGEILDLNTLNQLLQLFKLTIDAMLEMKSI
ncbi:hypothetical protein [Flavobacterium sp.]|uniref:hypothetical protein n=1 Tax=Flavobacterium sp. TaxID=239 RepID=UPI0031E3AF57